MGLMPPHIHSYGASMSRSPHWTVLSSRNVLDASPFLKVRVETIELPDGRRITDYYQLEMP
jgi:ADP-ribose pyrophosphatase